MKKLVMGFASLILAISTSVDAEPIRVTDENIPFLYESRAEIQTSEEKLARIISVDYRRARDEFSKMELLQKIKPVISKKLSESKEIEEIKLLIGSRLKEYDFDKSAFPTGFGSGTYIPFKNGYAVNFENAEIIEFIKIPVSEAKNLSSMLRKTRKVGFEVKGKIISVKEEMVNYSTKKLVTVEIQSVVVKTKKGKIIYEAKL